MRGLWLKRRFRVLAYAVVGAAAIGAVVAAAPWSRPHDDGPLPVLAGPRAASHIDPRLSRIATALSGRRLEVRCWSAADWRARAAEVKRDTPAHVDVRSPWSGYMSLDHKRANFGPNACRRLAALAYRHQGPSSYDDAWWLSWSLALFAHVTGPSESKTAAECHAMQHIDRTGEAAGLAPPTAARLSRLFWSDVYPREAEEFRSEDCRPGGKLDLDPADPAWP